jgi:hypothetical protein
MKRRTNGHITLNPTHPKPGSDSVDILIGTPTLGSVDINWHNAMKMAAAPPNWAAVTSTPRGYLTHDGQNMLVDTCLRGKFKALVLVEDDTAPPADAWLIFDRWFWKMERKQAPPVVSGLYHIKGSAEIRKGKKGGIQLLGPEPLIYRGSGKRAFRDWKAGDVVWCDGIPTGALMIHRSVLEAWANEPDVQTYSLPGYPHPLKRIFERPSQVWIDPEGGTHVSSGTSDLYWSAKTIERKILAKAGWPKRFSKRQYPYIVDTSMRFMHIDRSTGIGY